MQEEQINKIVIKNKQLEEGIGEKELKNLTGERYAVNKIAKTEPSIWLSLPRESKQKENTGK